MATGDPPFWKSKKLSAMTQQEWESLCDGCGKCCLNKLIDADSDALFFTNVACRLLDLKNCRCTRYEERSHLVKDCVRLTPGNVRRIKWLPETCAYRLVAAGEDLPSWHYLVCGDRRAVHRAGMSVKGRAISETEAGDLEDHIVDPL